MAKKKVEEERLRSWRHYIRCHLQAFIATIGRCYRAPIANALTIVVIGVAIALPTAFYVLLWNMERVSHLWDHGTTISLYLKMDTRDDKAIQLASELQRRPDVEKTRYISPQQGLQMFSKQMDFSDVVSRLSSNPLPGVIEVVPMVHGRTANMVQELYQELDALPEVDVAHLDEQWLVRLHALLQLGQRGVYSLAILLALGVLLIVGNTIRLDMQSYHEEMAIIKMVGASNHFIRRPFMYSGLVFGFMGGLVAWVLVAVGLWWLHQPVAHLSAVYGSNFQVKGLTWNAIVILLVISSMLGYCGSWLAVTRHIRAIEPS